jgi:hypothetical protein
MTAFVVILVLLIVGGIGYLVYVSSEAQVIEREPPPSVEELLQARLDLHQIERGVDLSLSKQEAQMAAERTKQAIADAMDDQR